MATLLDPLGNNAGRVKYKGRTGTSTAFAPSWKLRDRQVETLSELYFTRGVTKTSLSTALYGEFTQSHKTRQKDRTIRTTNTIHERLRCGDTRERETRNRNVDGTTRQPVTLWPWSFILPTVAARTPRLCEWTTAVRGFVSPKRRPWFQSSSSSRTESDSFQGSCTPRQLSHARNKWLPQQQWWPVVLQEVHSPLLPLMRRESLPNWVSSLTRALIIGPIMRARTRWPVARDSNGRSNVIAFLSFPQAVFDVPGSGSWFLSSRPPLSGSARDLIMVPCLSRARPPGSPSA